MTIFMNAQRVPYWQFLYRDQILSARAGESNFKKELEKRFRKCRKTV